MTKQTDMTPQRIRLMGLLKENPGMSFYAAGKFMWPLHEDIRKRTTMAAVMLRRMEKAGMVAIVTTMHGNVPWHQCYQLRMSVKRVRLVLESITRADADDIKVLADRIISIVLSETFGRGLIHERICQEISEWHRRTLEENDAHL